MAGDTDNSGSLYEDTRDETLDQHSPVPNRTRASRAMTQVDSTEELYVNAPIPKGMKTIRRSANDRNEVNDDSDRRSGVHGTSQSDNNAQTSPRPETSLPLTDPIPELDPNIPSPPGGWAYALASTPPLRTVMHRSSLPAFREMATRPIREPTNMLADETRKTRSFGQTTAGRRLPWTPGESAPGKSLEKRTASAHASLPDSGRSSAPAPTYVGVADRPSLPISTEPASGAHIATRTTRSHEITIHPDVVITGHRSVKNDTQNGTREILRERELKVNLHVIKRSALQAEVRRLAYQAQCAEIQREIWKSHEEEHEAELQALQHRHLKRRRWE
ncbi:uncharacterized protein BDZ99DRAFT_207365 [Mytilinidion resinicola]|uniref:Uncharacterized protein n=1 Tax=Mytilinidion resinicola TaxID=574789 RepID=A0A6A6Y170_9PEZI|nr:uncharacterized protein BDZ99DRAFT_207365 [Mytilinidion resinicola]KAF2802263.1 hypothetical protein BDZ99DRAFT_207365 [Mytilinidion resinicola]